MNRYLTKIKSDYYMRKESIEQDGICKYLFNSDGYILLIVLVISAFLISFTSEFFYKTHVYISYIKRFKSDINSEYLAYSGYELAKAILEVDRLGLGSSFMSNLSSDRSIDSYKDIWALEFPPLELPGGSVKISIEDENSKINISVIGTEFVTQSPYYGILQNLLGGMGLSIDIADCIMDWVDPDNIRFPYGAESPDYYQTLTPPYSASNEWMKSIDELLLVKLITPEIFYGLGGGNHGLEKNLVEHNKGDINIPLHELEGFISGEKKKDKSDEYREKIEQKIGKERDRALSNYLRVYGTNNDFMQENNKININTASFRVLSALLNEMNEDIIAEVIKKRQFQPFKNISEINEFITNQETQSRVSKLTTVKSYIFRIVVNVTTDNGFCRYITYYSRDSKKILYCAIEH